MSLLSLLSLFKNKSVVYVIAALLLAFSAIYAVKIEVNKKVNAAVDKVKADYESKRLKDLNDSIEATRKAVEQTNYERQKQNETLQANYDNLVHSTRKLSIPAKCPQVNDTVGLTDTSRAELDDTSIRFFADEAKRADELAIKHNALIKILEQSK